MKKLRKQSKHGTSEQVPQCDATVKNVSLTDDQKETAKRGQPALDASLRPSFIKRANEAANKFIVSFLKLKELNEEFGEHYDKAVRTQEAFKEELKRFCPALDELAPLFNKLRDGEDILGHRSLETLCPAELGVSASYVRRIRRQQHNLVKGLKPVPMLPEGEPGPSAHDESTKDNPPQGNATAPDEGAVDGDYEDVTTPNTAPPPPPQSTVVDKSIVVTVNTAFIANVYGSHTVKVDADPSQFTMFIAEKVMKEFFVKVIDTMQDSYQRRVVLLAINNEVQDRLEGTKEQIPPFKLEEGTATVDGQSVPLN